MKHAKRWCPQGLFIAIYLYGCFHGIPRRALAQGGQSSAAQQQETEYINLNLTGASLKNTLELLTNRLNKNFLLDNAVSDRTINMVLNNITPMDAFNAILEANNLGYRELEGNVFFITNRDKLGRATIVRHIPCRFATAEELGKILSSVVVSQSGTVIADTRTNTLIIKESPDVMQRIEKLIEELDKPVKQVFIQAAIVEISVTDDKEFGIEWLWRNLQYGDFEGEVQTEFELRPPRPLRREGEVTMPLGNGLGVGIINANIEAVLHALHEENDLNLLSRPRVVTMDNQESVIEVGDQIPFKVLNEFGITSFEFKDATVQLLVRPHIIDDQYVRLDVSPKADFQRGATADGTPIIATRRATTKVKVKNGQTLVIGGLMRDSNISTRSKVPILGSIPLIGTAFSNKKVTKVKTELIVFVTPIILEEDGAGALFKKEFELQDKLDKEFK